MLDLFNLKINQGLIWVQLGSYLSRYCCFMTMDLLGGFARWISLYSIIILPLFVVAGYCYCAKSNQYRVHNVRVVSSQV